MPLKIPFQNRTIKNAKYYFNKWMERYNLFSNILQNVSGTHTVTNVPWHVTVHPDILATRISPVTEQLVNACVMSYGMVLDVKLM